ncbi:hypothetical protein F4810DRAFT_709065 [Camillea tinctor]|nr:hypothetical protein F4810DRAFT_709065 [Camillea tinctor]
MRFTSPVGLTVGALMMLVDGIEAQVHHHQGPECQSTNFTSVPQRLEFTIEKEAVLRHVEQIKRISDVVPFHHRVTGSVGSNSTINYIANQLKTVGYDIEVVPFSAEIQVYSRAELMIEGNPVLHMRLEQAVWSPYGKWTHRRVVPASNDGCHIEDYPHRARGQVAVVNGVGCPLSKKSSIAKSAGVAVLMVTEDTELQPTLGNPDEPHVATVKLIAKNPSQLLSNLTHTNTTAYVDIEVHTKLASVESASIIATSKCGYDGRTLMLGTRTDSFHRSAGLNDNASGVAALLETAIQLSKYRTTNRVKFAFWTAGHSDNYGSRAWAQRQSERDLDQIKFYLDANMLGSANGFPQVIGGTNPTTGLPGPAGSDRGVDVLRGFFGHNHIASKVVDYSGRGDYQTFLDVGIPAAGLFGGADGIKTPWEASNSPKQRAAAGMPYDPVYNRPTTKLGALLMDPELL